MPILVDFGKVMELHQKQHDGRNITPDMIASCVIGTRFSPDNGRSEAVEAVKNTILSAHGEHFDHYYSELLKNYKSAGEQK